jgi:thymidine phosphorylase
MKLGAGRLRLDSAIDYGVGLRSQARIGDEVDRSSPLATIYFNDARRADEAGQMIERAYSIDSEPTAPPRLIKAVLR